VTLLPPLKYIRSLRSVKLPTLLVTSPTKPDLVAEPVPPLVTPATVMAQIGGHLGYWRNQHGLSIEEVSTLTQIQPRLIQAIEEGHIEMLPESVYVKGMIGRYGNCLGMDGDGLAQLVPTWQREVLVSKQTSTRGTSFTQPRIKPIHWYIIYALALLAGSSTISHVLNEAAKPAYPIVERATTPVVTPVEIATPTPIESPNAIQVRIIVKTPIWVGIVVDGNPKIVGNLKAGEQRDWIVTDTMTIDTSDGSGLYVSQGQQPFQALSAQGQRKQMTIKVAKKPEPKVENDEVKTIDP
jgi:hypothetical protein